MNRSTTTHHEGMHRSFVRSHLVLIPWAELQVTILNANDTYVYLPPPVDGGGAWQKLYKAKCVSHTESSLQALCLL